MCLIHYRLPVQHATDGQKQRKLNKTKKHISLSVQHLNDIDNLDGLPWFINIPQMMIHNDFGYTVTILNKKHQVST